MNKIAIVYWSGTGNTKSMAELIFKGAKESGSDVNLFNALEFDATKVDAYDVIAFGCPSMGAEELEDGEFEPMFESCKGSLNSKKLALFGSYGWGDGEWMRSWEDSCVSDGLNLVSESLICNETPEGESSESCEALGKSLVSV